MVKGEIAHFEQFHLFPQCFTKAFYFNVLKWVYLEERVKGPVYDIIRFVIKQKWVYQIIIIRWFYWYNALRRCIAAVLPQHGPISIVMYVFHTKIESSKATWCVMFYVLIKHCRIKWELFLTFATMPSKSVCWEKNSWPENKSLF